MINNENETKLNLTSNFIKCKSYSNMLLLRGKDVFDVKDEEKIFSDEVRVKLFIRNFTRMAMLTLLVERTSIVFSRMRSISQ